MSPTTEEQIERLKSTIVEMEAQRDALGDSVVQKSVNPLYEKLEELNRMLEVSRESHPDTLKQQRKLVTILFVDIVGSTSIIQNMDPEDVSEAFDANLIRLAKPVEDFGGRVTSFMGDGFLAIFGAPTAREDDPERAVRAGLGIIKRADEIAKELEKNWDIQDFKVRVGVNTGLIILGGETEGEDTTKGPAVHLAARLQSAAPPGGMLISHDTYRHIRGVFDVETWEPLKVKGFDEPVRVYQVLRARPRAFRMYTRGVEGVETRMVGRHDELKYLQDALLSAIEGSEGQVVTIIGEAGVGKSRLLYEFQNWIELLPPPAIRLYEGKAHQEAQGMPYELLRDLFEFRFQLQENDTRENIREKVESGFLEVFSRGDEGQMRSHILGHWLGFDFSTSLHMKGVLSDPEQLRNRGRMYLGEYFRGLCGQGPVVVFLEDIHWADDSSLDTLDWLGERLHHQQLLFVCAARHTLLERRPFWGEGLAYHHCLELEPLSRRESHQLVGEILKLAEQVPPELFELVVEGAEGNPFYVEELVKMLVEDGVVEKGVEIWQVIPGRLSEIKVPPTLAGVLQARLESLPAEEQQVLQQASVVGRLFWDRVVAHIQAAEGGKPQGVPEALNSLRSKEMVYRREASAFTDAREYLFKHDILREVTYESVLKRLRKKYHGLVADWLIAQVGGRLGEYGGLIAGHLLQAGRQEQACGYYLQAGEAALASYANREAEGYYRQALELSQADDPKAACLKGLGDALFAQGSRQEAVKIYRQGIDLYLKLDDSNAAADLYHVLSATLWYDDYQKAYEVCQDALRLFESALDSPGKARLLAEAGRTAYFQARPIDEVIALCERAIEMAERQDEQRARLGASITIALCMPDFEKSTHLMQEVAVFSEANRLVRPALRAHTNLGVIYSYHYQNLELAIRHHLQAIDIAINIGEIEMLFFELDNLTTDLIKQGKLNTLKDQLAEILRRTTASEAWVKEFLAKVSFRLLAPRGEWTQALEYSRHLLDELRKTGSYQNIANENLNMASACLELNRFTGITDITEAEVALRENTKWHAGQSRFKLVVLLSRQRRLAEAREQLAEVIQELEQPIHKPFDVYRFQAEEELARAEGRWEEVITNCQALINIYQAGGYRWAWARQLIDLGDCLLGRNLPGDRVQAEKVYGQSLEMFTEMGATGYIKVLEERLGGESTS